MKIANRSFIIGHYFIFCLIINISQQEPLVGQNVRDAEENEFPSVVALKMRTLRLPSKQFCTGTLISEKHVLTAAHCIANLHPISFYVSIGSINLDHATQYYPSHFITYTQWKDRHSKRTDESLHHDIAIITLNSSVSGVEPAKLSKLTSNELIGSTLKIAGWGITNNNVLPKILKAALLNFISIEDCNRQFSISTNDVVNDIVKENQFCSGAIPWVLSECGDSGGPSFDKDDRLLGVTMGKCPGPDYFDIPPKVIEESQLIIHLSVEYYRDFIKSVANIE